METKEPESPNSSSDQQEFSLKTVILIVLMIGAAIVGGLLLT
jgi:hypothetical protein